MTVSMVGKKVAVLLSSGFDEAILTEIQRAIVKTGASIALVAPDSGLINGWQGTVWGHHFHVDAQIAETLGSDYDFLILAGGIRSVARLKDNLHTKRIIGHFLATQKPISAIGAGVGLLGLCAGITGRILSANDEARDMTQSSGAVLSADEQCQDKNILTCQGNDIGAWVKVTVDLFSASGQALAA